MSKSVTPDVKEILATGLQFGHSTSRWNPLMRKYIFGAKGDVHIIDVVQTREALQKAAEFIQAEAALGEVLFIATKRQATEIMKAAAISCGAHYVINRWPAGLFSNWNTVQRSLIRLRQLEKGFEEGVEDRTKYEISRMKAEWVRLNRLYGGVKNMQALPRVVVAIDPRFEKVAVREARKVHVPVIALTDTNCDPRLIDWVIPGNDDAIKAIELVMTTLAQAVKVGNGGKGVVHDSRDYATVEVKIIKKEEEIVPEQELAEELGIVEEAPRQPVVHVSKPTSKKQAGKGLLEIAKERSEAAKK